MTHVVTSTDTNDGSRAGVTPDEARERGAAAASPRPRARPRTPCGCCRSYVAALHRSGRLADRARTTLVEQRR